MMSKHKKYSRWIPLKTRKLVLERDGNCQVCGSTSELCISRIIPGSKGGLPVEENLQVLCRTCVAIKRDYTLSNDDLRMYLARYETLWLENDKNRIGRINSMIRYDFSEREKAENTHTVDSTSEHGKSEGR